jgi:hypothetical protein
MLILGLLILAAAVVVGADAAAGNTGSAHSVPGGFHFFGYLVHGSTGQMFLAGIVVGAVGLLGLAMVIDGINRSARLRRELAFARREVLRSRRRAADAEKVAADAETTRPAQPVYPVAAPVATAPKTDAGAAPAAADPTDSGTAAGESSWVPAWASVTRRRSQPAATAGSSSSTDSSSNSS